MMGSLILTHHINKVCLYRKKLLFKHVTKDLKTQIWVRSFNFGHRSSSM